MSDGGPPMSDPNPLAALSPPHWVITDDDHGPYVIIATWTMMCFMVMTVTARLARKISIRAWGLDDYLISAAATFGLVQCGILHRAVVHGLGQRLANVNEANRDYFNKSNFAFQILFIATICLSKASLMHFITRLTPNVTMTRACHAVQGVIAVWGIATIFAISFQCPLPTPWDTTNFATCSASKQGSLMYATAVLDFLTDLVITAFPIIMMWNVQIPHGQRMTVIAVFLVRAIVPLAEIARLFYIHRHVSSPDPTFSMVDLSIWTQVVTNLSLTTACIPCLKPFLAALGSGVLDTRLPTGFDSRADYTMNSGGQNSRGPSNNGTRNNGSGNHNRGDDQRGKSQLNFYGGGKTSVIRTNIEGQTGNGLSGGIQRSESKTRLTQDKGDDNIYRTTEFQMDVDDSPPGSRKKM